MTDRFPASSLDELKKVLAGSDSIVITTHHRPDGDAMGSALGLYNYLEGIYKNVSVVVPSIDPDFLHWLPGRKNVVFYDQNPAEAIRLMKQSQVIFCLDFNWMNRVENLEPVLRESSAYKILLDHHLDPEDAYNMIFSYPDACSTCELVYQLIVALGDRNRLTPGIADCLYCGIMTDTNSFRYSSMKSYTHRIIADLMDAGAVNYRIHEKVYDQSTESRLRLLGYSLKDKLIVLPEFHTAYIALSGAELDRFNYKTGDTEGLVNYALSIEGIRLAGFFTERDGLVKISLRSKGNFSVKELAAKYFSGGGHRNASGGQSSGNLEQTVGKFLSLLPEYQAQLQDEN